MSDGLVQNSVISIIHGREKSGNPALSQGNSIFFFGGAKVMSLQKIYTKELFSVASSLDLLPKDLSSMVNKN